jgi:hypothetical protein
MTTIYPPSPPPPFTVVYHLHIRAIIYEASLGVAYEYSIWVFAGKHGNGIERWSILPFRK